MAKPETRVIVMEYKSQMNESDNPTFRHDQAAYRYTDTDFTAKPTEVRIGMSFEDFARDGKVYKRSELLAHIENLQAIADTLLDDRIKLKVTPPLPECVKEGKKHE